MCVDRNALKLVDLSLAQSALDGGADLPAVQDDRSGRQAASPESRDAMLAHEAQHGVIGRAEPSVCFDPEHHLPEAVGCDRRYHAGEFGD
jgi:hypothetical protein